MILYFLIYQAYYEFGNLNNNMTQLINKYNNLIVTRTFSKFFGLVGTLNY
jgi:histidinol-phosphate/aromatic aminotransferase/cobyric acid decarboxylase-like protein